MNRLFVILTLLFFIYYHLCSATVFNAADNYAINCGSSGSSAATDGRKWIGDVRSRLSTFSIESRGKLISSSADDSLLSLDRIPFATAQVSRSDFTYTFKLNPGPKFIRLHFHPSSYASFKRYTSLFTVKAGIYTLLDDFSPSITADASGLKAVTKEFCIHVRENQPLRITFSPSPDNNAFAFINGIEVLSMPANLYYSNRLPIDETIALEAIHRLNIGGKSIPAVEDTGMFREWMNDSSYLLMESTVFPIATTLRIRYGKVPSYIAPQKIYQTSWSINSDVEVKNSYTFTWKLPVDTGFRYLLRLHFCELDYEMKEIGQKKFNISINNQTVEGEGDLIKWGGEIGFAFYRDYMFEMEGDIMEGKQDVFVSIHPHLNKEILMVDAILKGMEVLKLSDSDNNLAGVNPNVPPTYDSKTRGFQNILILFSTGSLIFVSYIFLHRKKEIMGSRNIDGDNHIRKFSLSEIRKATKDFSIEKVLRSDDFGTIYEGTIDRGTTMVEVRRLRCMQEEEFTTVIQILPNLRHENLIGLIGYCREKQEIILVYEHMVNGTFADHIFPTGAKANSPLNWEERLKVCSSAALGLNYLHTTHNTIHRDVKSASILLNENFSTPKISDFRLCRTKTTNDVATDITYSHVSTEVKGTTGYHDPQYFLTRRLTKKSDVYSLGVVMWEALCGRPALGVGTRRNERNLAIWAHQCYMKKEIVNIIDPSIKQYISLPCLQVFTAIAIKCIHNDPNKRLTMDKVAVFLKNALEFQIRGDHVNELEVVKLIDRIGIDAEQSGLSNAQKNVLKNMVLNSHEIGPYSQENLFMVLEIYESFSDFFPDKTTLVNFRSRIMETLGKFEENNSKSANNNRASGDKLSHVEIDPLTMNVRNVLWKGCRITLRQSIRSRTMTLVVSISISISNHLFRI